MVRKNSPYKTIEDLKGQKVASLTGSTDIDTLKAQVAAMGGGVDVVAYRGRTSAISRLLRSLRPAACTTMTVRQPGRLLSTTRSTRWTSSTPMPQSEIANEATANPYVLGSVGMITHAADNDFNRAL